jgi:DNA-binding transcriptional MerR regulator
MKPEAAQQFEPLSVRDARKLFGLTYRAMRYYEELGLVVAHRDSANSRWYDARGRARLAWIARLRRSLPLHEIAEILSAEEREPGKGIAIALLGLGRRRARLEDELAGIAVLAEALRR